MTSQPEKKIENAILQYLAYRGILAIKLQHTGIFDPISKKFRKINNPLHKNSEGLADILVHTTCVGIPASIYLEVKTDKGKQSEKQKEFEGRVTRAGTKYYVVRSLEDVIKIFEEKL